MSRLLTTTALLALLAGGAHAGEMPKHLVGLWCTPTTVFDRVRNYEFENSCDDPFYLPNKNSITVKAGGFEGETGRWCRLLKLAGERGAYRMTFRCDGPDGQFVTRQQWEMKTGGTLLITNIVPKLPFRVEPNPGIVPKDRSE